MKFWLPVRFEPVGKPPIVTDDPDTIKELKRQGQPMRRAEFRIQVGGNKVFIRQETDEKEQAVCKALMECGQLEFNPQDAVDEKIFTKGEMIAMGFMQPDPEEEVEVKAPEVEELPPALPDFDTMSKAHLVEWADSQNPPIHLDRRKRKTDLVKEVREFLKEK